MRLNMRRARMAVPLMLLTMALVVTVAASLIAWRFNTDMQRAHAQAAHFRRHDHRLHHLQTVGEIYAAVQSCEGRYGYH
jgi:sensor domain CHASE-containing protein